MGKLAGHLFMGVLLGIMLTSCGKKVDVGLLYGHWLQTSLDTAEANVMVSDEEKALALSFTVDKVVVRNSRETGATAIVGFEEATYKADGDQITFTVEGRPPLQGRIERVDGSSLKITGGLLGRSSISFKRLMDSRMIDIVAKRKRP